MIEFPVLEIEIEFCLKLVMYGVYETVAGGVTADLGIRMKIVPEKRQLCWNDAVKTFFDVIEFIDVRENNGGTKGYLGFADKGGSRLIRAVRPLLSYSSNRAGIHGPVGGDSRIF